MRFVTILITAAVFVLSITAFAGSSIDSVEPDVRAELTTLVEKWIEAEVQSDGKALEALLHEDFLSTFGSGTTVGRKAYIDIIVSMDIPPFKVINESMVQYGNTVVVIDVSDDGTTKFTWIAVREEGEWKVIAQTFSALKRPDGG